MCDASVSRKDGTHGENCVYIGQDSKNRWVVQDASSRRGGFFINRTEALRFAFSERLGRSQAVIMVPGPLELRLA